MILVTGATGKLGARLVPALAKAGFKLRLLDFSASKAKQLFPKLKYEFVEADLVRTPIEKLAEACRGCEAVTHLAGVVDYSLPELKIMSINYGGTEKMAVAAKRAGVKRFILMSSTSIYGRLKEFPTTEKTAPSPSSAYGRSKLLAEHAVKRAKIPYIILRPTIIYGPGFDAGFGSVARGISKGKMKIIGDGTNRVPFVHVDDVVRAVVLALKAKKLNEDYIIAGSEVMTQKQALEEVARAVGARPPREKIPKLLALLAAGSAEKREYAHVLGDDRLFSYAKARKMLGFKPKVKLRAALKELVPFWLGEKS